MRGKVWDTIGNKGRKGREIKDLEGKENDGSRIR